MAELSLDDVLNIIEDTHPNEETCSEPRPSNRATVRQRFGAGLRPGLLRHAKQKRTRKQRLKKNKAWWTNRQMNTMPVAVLEGPTMRFQLQQMTLSEKQRKAKVNGNGGPPPLFCVLDSAQSQQLPDKSPAALKEVGQSMLEGVGCHCLSHLGRAKSWDGFSSANWVPG